MEITLNENIFKLLYESLSEEEKQNAIAQLEYNQDIAFEVNIKGTVSKGVTSHEFYTSKLITKSVVMIEGQPAQDVIVITGERQIMPIKPEDMNVALHMILQAATQP